MHIMNDTLTTELTPSTLPAQTRPALPSVARETSLTTLQPPKRRSTPLVLMLLAVVLGVAVIGWYSVRSSRSLPDGLIQANGRIESDVVNVSSKLAGRIVTLGAREGDVVKAGAPLVQLDDRAV